MDLAITLRMPGSLTSSYSLSGFAAAAGRFGLRGRRGGLLDHGHAGFHEPSNVALDDASVGAGCLGVPGINAGLLRQRAGARRNLQAAVRGLRGLRRGGLLLFLGLGRFVRLHGGRFGGSAGLQRAVVLALRADGADVCEAGNLVPVTEENGEELALFGAFALEGGLIRFVGEQNVANLHRVAHVLEPLSDDAGFHRDAGFRHDDRFCHYSQSSLARVFRR